VVCTDEAKARECLHALAKFCIGGETRISIMNRFSIVTTSMISHPWRKWNYGFRVCSW